MNINPDYTPAGQELDGALLQLIYGPRSNYPTPDGFDPYALKFPSTRIEDAREMLMWCGGHKVTVLEPKGIPEIEDPKERLLRRPPWRVEFSPDPDENENSEEPLYVFGAGETEALALTRTMIKLQMEMDRASEV